MLEVQAFDTIEDMFAAIDAARDAADARIQPWQDAVKAGDYFVRCEEEWTIYGEVIECDDPFYQEPEGRGYRFTRCYSEACAEGELGDTHISSMTRLIDECAFNWCKENDWPYMTVDVLDWLIAHNWPPSVK